MFAVQIFSSFSLLEVPVEGNLKFLGTGIAEELMRIKHWQILARYKYWRACITSLVGTRLAASKGNHVFHSKLSKANC